MKNGLTLILKLVALTIMYMIIQIGAAMVLPSSMPAPPPEMMASVMGASVVIAAVNTLIISLLILQSRWYGLKLMLAAGWVFVGVQFILSAIEAAYYGPAIGFPVFGAFEMVRGGFVLTAIFVPLAVWILGKAQQPEHIESGRTLGFSALTWLWKLALLAVVYFLLYWGFGFYVAWQNPSLRALYNFGANEQVFNPVNMVLLQIFRSLVWAGLGVPVIKMIRGNRLQVGVILGITFSLLMSIVLIMPYNPFMPDAGVRLSHFLEITGSNFLFGLAMTTIVLWQWSPQTAAEPKTAAAK